VEIGGRGGIRTHGTLAGTPVFKTGALNHSATLPSLQDQALSRRKIKNSLATIATAPAITAGIDLRTLYYPPHRAH
jgi:hypothetical protein